MSKDDVLATAKERFERCQEHVSQNRAKQKADIRFAAASPDDPWQWESATLASRKLQQRPSLTINKQPQHIRQVTNDIRQNRPQIRYRPADSKADPEVAEILNGLARRIEAHSDADIAYDAATQDQVVHGEGFIRVMADYLSETSFDQDIFIKAVRNPFKVYLDPDAKDPAGADAKYAFVEDELAEDDFTKQYPKADPIDWDFQKDHWFSSDNKVKVVEYFEKVEKPAKLYMWASGETSFDGDPMPEGVMMGEQPIRSRESSRCKVMWRTLNGQQVLEEREFPSKYIPIARVVGNEFEVDGEIIVSGLVRNTKDSQRMYNIAQSAIVERVMQAPKAPWTAPAAAIEGYEKEWQTANTANHSFLPYNHKDDQNELVPPPTRVQPATVEPGLAQIATGASDDIKSETGQYDASLGQKSNETSGKAIIARQREGDNATFHYVSNLSHAVRHLGRIVLDMLPKIYDQKRVARIIGEDASVANATLDPQQQEALVEQPTDDGAIERIFNPFVGSYDVYASTGPSYTTQRMESVEAMTAMVQANPQLMGVIGDLMVKNMDWPGADDMAERLKLTLVPEVRQKVEQDGKADQIPPQVQMQLQQQEQQIAQLSEALEKAAEAAEDAEYKRMDAETKRYDAETKRLALTSTAIQPDQLKALVMQTLQEAIGPQVPEFEDGFEPSLEPEEAAGMAPESQGQEPETEMMDADANE